MQAPKVSIVMPVCNVERYLRLCIESALAQTLEDIEIIIMDDGSTDGSPQIIDYYARQDSRIKAVHKPNEGYGKSCNRGIDMAQGEYVAILESDDYIEPDMYERLYAYAKELDADVVKGPYRDHFADGTRKPYPHNDYLSECMPQGRLYSLADCPCQLATHQSIWTGIYRRAYLNEHAIRFVEAPGAGNVDIGFCIDSLAYSDRLAWLDEMFYNYRVLAEGSSTSNYNMSRQQTRWREVHDRYAKTELWDAIAPYLVSREAVGLFRYFRLIEEYTDEQLTDMQALACDFTEEQIRRAPLVSQGMREELVTLRTDREPVRQAIDASRVASGRKPLVEPAHAPEESMSIARLTMRELDLAGLYRLGVLALLGIIALSQTLAPSMLRSLLQLVLACVAIVAALLLVLFPYKRAKKAQQDMANG